MSTKLFWWGLLTLFTFTTIVSPLVGFIVYQELMKYYDTFVDINGNLAFIVGLSSFVTVVYSVAGVVCSYEELNPDRILE